MASIAKNISLKVYTGKDISRFYEIQGSITVFAKSRHYTPFSAIWVNSFPVSEKLFVLILFSQLYLVTEIIFS